MKRVSWEQLDDEQQQQHEEEIAVDYDEMKYKQEPWWKHLDEWMKEKVSGYE